jgi:phage tail sheath protein FI
VFNDAETIDVNLLIGAPSLSGADGVTQANNLIAIAENRKDVVAFVSPPVDATVGTLTPKDDVIAFADQLSASSYGFLDSTALKVYDKYNDVYRWIPAAGHMAGLCAKTDNVADAWFSPGGYTRGQVLGVTRVAFNPKKAERDDLYKKRVNPVVSFPGEGTILFGDKTLQAKPSAFDRINVRRLFIVLEKAIATAAKYQLFELNDEFTRAMFRNMTEPFLREIKGRRGITDFKVVCDATNNTGEIIDTNQFVADIYIKPARSINFINLNFIATRTGVNFSEIGG